MNLLIRCLTVLACLINLSALSLCAAWTEENLVHPPVFTLDYAGRSFEAADFPNPQALEILTKEWHQEIQDKHPDFQEIIDRDGDCRMIWMYHMDFDGDAKEETFFAFGLNGYGIYPSTWLCFMDSSGNVTRLDESSIIDGKIIRYPGRAQLCYSSSFSTGLSFQGRVLGYQDGKVVKLLEAHTDDFRKEGPYLATVPRVGAAGETVVCIYQWDESAAAYRWVKPAECSLDALPAPVREIAARQTGKLTRAARYALPYYLLGFDGPEGERALYVRRKPDGCYEASSRYYAASFDGLAGYPGEGDASVPVGI